MDSIQVLVSQWGYLAVFGCVVLGNFGVPVPEEAVLWVAGYLVWEGRLQLPFVLVVGIVAAVAGDNLGYCLGRRYGRRAVARCGQWVHVPPHRLEAMQHFVARHGSFGVFIARFVAGLRFLAGPLAGSLGPRPVSFVTANVLGALCYVPLMVAGGYAVGYEFRKRVSWFVRAEPTVGKGLVLGGILLGLLFLGYRTLARRRQGRRLSS